MFGFFYIFALVAFTRHQRKGCIDNSYLYACEIASRLITHLEIGYRN